MFFAVIQHVQCQTTRTHDSVWLVSLQLIDGDEVEGHIGKFNILCTKGHLGLAVEGHFVVVVYGAVTFVCRLQVGFGDVVHL